MSARSKLAWSCTTFLALVATAFAANTYTTIDFPGATMTAVAAINNDGDMAGGYVDSSGVQHGFTFFGGVFMTVDPPGTGPDGSAIWGINDERQVVGTYLDANNTGHGFLFDGVNFTTLDYPGSVFTDAFGINDAGTIVGAYSLNGHGPAGYVLKNGRYSTVEPRKNNETVQLMQISATGEIVGDSRAIGGKLFGFKYRRGIFKPIIYPGADQTTPYGLNDNGVIVGSFLINGSEQSCFALVGSEYLRVRFPGAVQQMNCFDVNNTGQIVGGYFDGTSFHGFLITPGQ